MAEHVLIELLRGKGAHVDPFACVEDVPVQLADTRSCLPLERPCSGRPSCTTAITLDKSPRFAGV
jgi:hypothetical protein